MSPSERLAEWNACRSWLEPAIGPDSEEGEVINDLLLNRAQLWRGDRGAMVTRLVKAPEPYVMVWLGGGDLTNLLELQPGVEAWARAQGCKAARINGRKGWARALKHTGFEDDTGELRKAL